MSEPSARAIEWLGQQIGELSGIRNATARDPSFKNWRQNTLTVMQRIWPADQGRCERFRRIPFSPADPRAEVRVQREWYSRGCQEAARVLASFVDEIRREGVPDLPPELAESASDAEFEDDFPTVELPAGEADPAAPPYSPPDPRFTAAPAERSSPQHAEPPSPQPAEPLPGSRGRKGLGVAAKLRDLLGFAGLSAKALTGPLLEPFNPAPPPPRPTPSAPDLGIIPVGDDVTPVPRAYPPPQAPDQPRQPQPGNLPDAGKSVIMSKPTTLRTSIEKVSIESLISPQFRAGGEPGTGTPDAVGVPGFSGACRSSARFVRSELCLLRR